MRARLMLLLLVIPACGKSDEQKAAEAIAAQVEAASKQMAAAMKDGGAAAAGAAMGAVQAAEAVDFRELKALLPEELSGMKRGDAEGEKTGSMGFTRWLWKPERNARVRSSERA